MVVSFSQNASWGWISISFEMGTAKMWQRCLVLSQCVCVCTIFVGERSCWNRLPAPCHFFMEDFVGFWEWNYVSTISSYIKILQNADASYDFMALCKKIIYAMYAYKSSPSGQGPASWNSCSRLCGSARRALEHLVFLVRALFSWILRRICDRRALRMGILSWTTWW